MIDQNENIWPKKITVDSRIVAILSGSTYENFPSALRELIINSYDADANEVEINIDLEEERIVVKDDGRGMDEDDFNFYLRIAGKTRQKEITSSGRGRIGQFGVGFLSVFPFCKNFLIETTKRGSNEVIVAEIPSHKYFTKENKITDVDAISIQGGIRNDDTKKFDQYTKITLNGFSELSKAFLNQDYSISGRRNTILKYSPLERLKWELCEDLPLKYDDAELNKKFTFGSEKKFKVFLNGSKPLKRNLFASNILETHENDYEEVGDIKFRYFIATDYEPIAPVEGRFLKLRNLNVGVGDRTSFDIGLHGKTYSRLSHITGEIHILDGMNDLIAVSRDKFNFSPDYEKLKEFFRDKIRHWANRLEYVEHLERDSKRFLDFNKIHSLGNLDPKIIEKKIGSLIEKGFQVDYVDQIEVELDGVELDSFFKLDKENKKILVPKNLSDVRKKLSFDDQMFALEVEEWDPSKSKYPSCKITKNRILINKNYSQFSSRKHLDIFVKMHLLIIKALKDGLIDESLYQNFLEKIETNFKDY